MRELALILVPLLAAGVAFACMVISAITSFMQPLLIGLTVKAGVQHDTDLVLTYLAVMCR